MMAGGNRERARTRNDQREHASAGRAATGFDAHAPECGEAAAGVQVSRWFV
jgi:hypothetical protein